MVQIFDYHSWSNWNLEMLIFEKRGKLEYPQKTFQSKGENEQQTQPTWYSHLGLNLDHIGGRRLLSPLAPSLLPTPP